MARFALFTNGVKVETLEDLKNNFTLKDMENNFRTKSLHRWLTEKGLRDELQRIENIPSYGDNLELLMECFALSDEQRNAVKRRAEDEAKRVQEEQKAQAKRDCSSFSEETSGIGIPMPEDLFIGEESVLLTSWRVRVGDKIKKGDILCEVETGKTTREVNSEFAGTIVELLSQEGDSVSRFTPVLKLEMDSSEISIPFFQSGGILSPGVIISWCVKVGDKIKRGDILYKIKEGESITEVKSRFDGVVSEILVPDGEFVDRVGDSVLKLKTLNTSPALTSCGEHVDVFLTIGNEENKIWIIKELRFASDCDLKEAKDTYESIPSAIVKNTSLDAAEIIKKRIERLGGAVSFNNSQYSKSSLSDAEYDVILQNYPPANKIAVIKELRTFTPSDDLKRAKELAEAVPNATIAVGVSIEAAKIMKRILEVSGIDGKVVINESEHSNQAKPVGSFSSSSPFVQNKEKQNSLAGSNIQTIDRIAAVVKQIIGNQLAIKPQEIKDSDDIIADLGADEADIREIQWSISQEFDVNFDHLTNVGQIIACVKRR